MVHQEPNLFLEIGGEQIRSRNRGGVFTRSRHMPERKAAVELLVTACRNTHFRIERPVAYTFRPPFHDPL